MSPVPLRPIDCDRRRRGKRARHPLDELGRRPMLSPVPVGVRAVRAGFGPLGPRLVLQPALAPEVLVHVEREDPVEGAERNFSVGLADFNRFFRENPGNSGRELDLLI